MKLLFCPECNDIIKIQRSDRSCLCFASGGRYFGDDPDNNEVAIWGKAIVLGVSNQSFHEAYRARQRHLSTEYFDAWFFSEKAPHITRYEKDSNGSMVKVKAGDKT